MTETSNITDFVKKAKARLLSWMEEVGLQTPSDTNISCSQLSQFCEKFVQKATKSENDELPESLPNEFLPDPGISTRIEANAIMQILRPFRNIDHPLPAAISTEEYLSQYTPEERNALYEYAVQHTTKIQVPPEIFMDPEEKIFTEDESNEETYEQKILRLQKERDLKRRRQAYRRKVSTKNKSYVEVQREMINNFMEAISDQVIVKADIQESSTTGVSDNFAGNSRVGDKVVTTEKEMNNERSKNRREQRQSEERKGNHERRKYRDEVKDRCDKRIQEKHDGCSENYCKSGYYDADEKIDSVIYSSSSKKRAHKRKHSHDDSRKEMHHSSSKSDCGRKRRRSKDRRHSKHKKKH